MLMVHELNKCQFSFLFSRNDLKSIPMEYNSTNFVSYGQEKMHNFAIDNKQVDKTIRQVKLSHCSFWL